MKRNILLIEPNYKNKYPPIGLMKISSYHKLLGDNVKFYKGNLVDLLYEDKINKSINYLKRYSDPNELLEIKQKLQRAFKYNSKKIIYDIIENRPNKVKDKLADYLLNQLNQRKNTLTYDRIYITTLFTFYWNVTIKTINFAKRLVDDTSQIYVGGIMASLLKNEVGKATGITPIYGLLDKPGLIDKDNNYIIDELPLDYSILHEIDYKYPTDSSFITFMTKGCTRNCPFCSVPQLEPIYKDIIPTKHKYELNKEVYGEQKNLLLMDNNVLASPRFSEIIKEIKEMGFYKGAKYELPNEYDVAIKNLKSGLNDLAYKRKFLEILKSLNKKIKDNDKDKLLNIIESYKLFNIYTVTKTNILKAHSLLKPLFDKYHKRISVGRYVDFNQGIDARYLNENNIKLLSELSIKPLRIAFDHIGISEKYIRAIRLAAKYDLKYLSNYILYNFADHPIDLYKRLKINIELNKELNLQIFSFPMRYIPIYGEGAKGRAYVGKYWNKKFLRAIQCILNATKGIVAWGYDFFMTAFGNNEEEFMDILYMPETFIINREKFKKTGLTAEWRKAFNSLSDQELSEAKSIIENNDFKNISLLSNNYNVIKLLSYYTISNKELDGKDLNLQEIKKKFKKLIREDVFINLTLTYDYEVDISTK